MVILTIVNKLGYSCLIQVKKRLLKKCGIYAIHSFRHKVDSGCSENPIKSFLKSHSFACHVKFSLHILPSLYKKGNSFFPYTSISSKTSIGSSPFD